jgi:Fic family protein
MSYIEQKSVRGKKYIYLVRKLSFLNKKQTIKKYIGSFLESPTKEAEKEAREELNKKELNFKIKFLPPIINKISFNLKLPEKIERKNIQISNILELKNCKDYLNQEFAKEFIFNSNNIEGSKIPPEKVREILEKGDSRYADKNEVREVRNSLKAWNYIQKDFKFNKSSIKRLYHILTEDLLMEGKVPYPKGFKKIANIVGNSQTTPPEEVETEIEELLDWYKQNRNKIHPLLLAFEFHKRYEYIHPFLDGNGRTGRFIMNKILIANKYQPMIVYKENKESYFGALEKSIDGKGKKYYQFLLEQMHKTYNYLLEKAIGY